MLAAAKNAILLLKISLFCLLLSVVLAEDSPAGAATHIEWPLNGPLKE